MALELCLGLNPSSSTYQVFDIGKSTSPLRDLFSSDEMKICYTVLKKFK